MSQTDICPNCNSRSTEDVDRFKHADAIEVTRVCNDCPTQYTVVYGNPIVQDVVTNETHA